MSRTTVYKYIGILQIKKQPFGCFFGADDGTFVAARCSFGLFRCAEKAFRSAAAPPPHKACGFVGSPSFVGSSPHHAKKAPLFERCFFGADDGTWTHRILLSLEPELWFSLLTQLKAQSPAQSHFFDIYIGFFHFYKVDILNYLSKTILTPTEI